MQSPNYIFGPVPSRRLGRSLGIDLIPYKICSFDCIYCQLGRTTTKTMTRREYLPTDEIIAGIERKLKETCEFDYITLSGSGEPTLHSGLGVLIEAIKKLTRKPLAVITNGSLLKDATVRAELMAADIVMPSLDAGTQEYFETVNRPCPGLRLDDVVDGLAHFSREFKGKLWLEVFLLGGSFDPVARAWEIADLTRLIRPSLIQLNTVARPPCECFALPVSPEVMTSIRSCFPAPVEVIADFVAAPKSAVRPADRDEIIRLLMRRPCGSQDVAAGLGIHHLEALKILEELVREKAVAAVPGTNGFFYSAVKTGEDE